MVINEKLGGTFQIFSYISHVFAFNICASEAMNLVFTNIFIYSRNLLSRPSDVKDSHLTCCGTARKTSSLLSKLLNQTTTPNSVSTFLQNLADRL